MIKSQFSSEYFRVFESSRSLLKMRNPDTLEHITMREIEISTCAMSSALDFNWSRSRRTLWIFSRMILTWIEDSVADETSIQTPRSIPSATKRGASAPFQRSAELFIEARERQTKAHIAAYLTAKRDRPRYLPSAQQFHFY